jgi:hypothetical protein
MEKIKIKLSDRAPITITEESWPIVAFAEDWRGGNGIQSQANEEWWVRVRQHADGRAIVYASRERGNGGMPIDYRGAHAGYVLAPTEGRVPSADIVRAIRRVAGAIGRDGIADACIADLPAEEL